MLNLKQYMELKGLEYRKFDPSRARNIFIRLQKYIPKKSTNIQIIGTNGKGSTGRFIALLLSDYKVLHFTSPHIFSFNERFYKNGKIISELELENAHNYLQQFDFINEASYFEYATFLAYYLAMDVDYAIFEAGVGGEFDSTSAIDIDLSVFTLIDYDHEELLGDSIDKIATTKLKAMTNLSILGIQRYKRVKHIASKIAEKKGAKIHFLDSVNLDAINYVNKYNLASFLGDNLTTALKVVDVLGIKYNINTLKKLDIFARFERIRDNIIIDVGHNPNAAMAIKNEIKDSKIILIYNTYLQKNVRLILDILKDNILRVEIINISNNPRIIDRVILEGIIESMGIKHCSFTKIDNQYLYLVFGSFSVVEKFMGMLQ